MKKDKKLSEIDRKIGASLISCRQCKMEFYTLDKEEVYCPYCELNGFTNPEKIQKRGRQR